MSRVIIAGSRTFNDGWALTEEELTEAIQESNFDIDEVVSGGCDGTDKLGEYWAIEHNISLKQFLADWDKFGKSAGPRRNQQMIDYVGKDGALILIWDGKSRGSFDILSKAFFAGLEIFVKTIR